MGNPWGSEETAQITHGKVKRGEREGSPLMMLILPEEGRSITGGGGRGFRLEPFKGIKREREEGSEKPLVLSVPLPNS